MKEDLNKRLEKLAIKARTTAPKTEVKSAGPSSLHQIIKTKEQAALFMKLLKEA
jgi:hypothetical protein